MKQRLATVWPQKSYSSDITEIIDIDVKQAISQLVLDFSVTNGASTATDGHPADCITKIELVDGSDVLYSLNGRQAEAVDWYQNGIQRPNWMPYLNGMGCQRFFALNFGRYLWDPMFALDPAKFNNLQLKVSLDIDAGGVSASANTLRVHAAIFDEKEVSPVGFLMHKEIKDYAMAASSHEYTDLPTDYEYRKMFVQCLTGGTEPNQLLDNIKLSEDQDRKVIFDHNTEEIFRAIAALTPEYIESIMCGVATSSRTFHCTPTTRVNGVCASWAATAGAGEIAFYDGDGGSFKVIAATAAKNIQVRLAGHLPHGVWQIPMGDPMDPDDWFDVRNVGSLKADLTAASGASSSNSAQIMLQQLRRYAA